MAAPTIVVTKADIIGRKVSTIGPIAMTDAVLVIEVSLETTTRFWHSESWSLREGFRAGESDAAHSGFVTGAYAYKAATPAGTGHF
jgi:hypothetical protein